MCARAIWSALSTVLVREFFSQCNREHDQLLRFRRGLARARDIIRGLSRMDYGRCDSSLSTLGEFG